MLKGYKKTGGLFGWKRGKEEGDLIDFGIASEIMNE